MRQQFGFQVMSLLNESEDKKKKMQICLNPTLLNKAVLREPFYYWTPDDVKFQVYYFNIAPFNTIVFPWCCTTMVGRCIDEDKAKDSN